jgi:hypothetical protein
MARMLCDQIQIPSEVTSRSQPRGGARDLIGLPVFLHGFFEKLDGELQPNIGQSSGGQRYIWAYAADSDPWSYPTCNRGRKC